MHKLTQGFIPMFIIVIIAIIAVLVVGAAWWYESQNDENDTTNTTNANTNTSVNSTVNANQNVNGTTNLNTNSVNANEAANTNTVADADCPVWPTYTNTEYGWTMQYPCDWTYEDMGEATGDDPFVEYPSRYTVFTDPTGEYRLLVGIMREGDPGSTITRTGVGAGDFIDVDPITVAGTLVPVRHLIYQGNLYEVFFYSSGAVQLGDYRMTATFDEQGDYTVDLTDKPELDQATTMMESLTLPD